MFKNVASQKAAVFAWDNAAGAAKTGDAANITAQISKDGGATAATNDVNPTELDATDAKGIYLFDMTQAETNADLVVISPVSSTSDIVLRPVIIYTQTVMRGTDGANTTIPDAAGVAPTAVEIRQEIDSNSTRLDADMTSRAPAATALTDVTWTVAKAGYIDAAISGRSPANEYDTEMARITANVATEAKQDVIDGIVDAILLDTETDGVVVAGASKTGYALSAAGIDEIHDEEVDNDGTAISLRGAMKLILSILTAISAGGGTTTLTFRDIADTKNRLSVTVDSNGNRTAVGTRDAS